MKLEEKLNYFVDLGNLDFLELENIQKKVMSSNLPNNYLIGARVNPHINFGSNRKKNLFSPEVMQSLESSYGKKLFYDENGFIAKNVLEDLKKKGVCGLDFSVSERGGGATVYTPGQYLFFPVWDFSFGRSLQEDFKNTVEFNDKIHDVMLEVAREIVPNSFLKEVGYSDTIKDVCRDLYVRKGDDDFKLGSKGIKLCSKTKKTQGGFSLFKSNCEMDKMGLVQVCGFHPDDLKVSSMESVLGSSLDHDRFIDLVLEKYSSVVGCKFENMSYEELNLLLK